MPCDPLLPVAALHLAARRLLGRSHPVVAPLAWAVKRPPAEGSEIAGRALDWIHLVARLEVLALAFAIQTGEALVRKRRPELVRQPSAREAPAAGSAG
ncbi:MAG TPA: hypothetical protein VIK47_06945, partial [Kiloniellales bacterium]